MLSDRVAFDKIYNKAAATKQRTNNGTLASGPVNPRIEKLHQDHFH